MKKLKYQTPILVLSSLSLLSIGLSSWIVNDTKSSNATNVSTSAGGVCYIDNDTSTLYTTIEKALEIARNSSRSDTIYVIPGTNPTITRDCTIASEDTLCLPYSGTTWEDSGRASTTNDNFADGNATNESNYLKNNVTISNSASLINRGTLRIGGILGVSKNNSKQRPSGHTVGNYSQISLDGNSSIENYGTITCYGYIKETSKNNASQVINYSGSSITLPFVIYDYRGASFCYGGLDAGVFPLNIFDFPNCSAKLVLYYNSKFNATYTLDARDVKFTDDITVVGPTSGLFILSSGYIEIKYTPSSQYGYTTIDSATTTTASNINKTEINIYGNASFSSISIYIEMDIIVAKAVIDMISSDYHCPISYKFDIVLNSGSTFNLDNKIKFLTGSSLLVNSGATLNLNASTIFYQTHYDEATTAAQLYPRTLTAAKFVNNGTLNINSAFAGFIETSNSSGKIVTSSNFTSTVSSNDMLSGARPSSTSLNVNYNYHVLTGYGFGIISESSTSVPSSTDLYRFTLSQTYLSGGQYWIGSRGSASSASAESYGSSISGSCSLASSVEPCVTSDTLITMKDGSYKHAIDIKTGDEVLIYNHETGQLDSEIVMFNDIEELKEYTVIECKFEHNISVKVIYEHAFFDLTLMKYVYIRENEFAQYLNHEFLMIKKVNNQFQRFKVKLIEVSIYKDEVIPLSPVTKWHLNFFTNDMLSMPGNCEGFFNIFEIDESLKYIPELKKLDLEKYGSFSYEDLSEYMPFEFYEPFPWKYFKVSIGKGMLTYETMLKVIKRYKTYFE